MDDAGIVAALAALAHEHRLRVFRLLVKQGPSGLTAGEIAEKVGISQMHVSRLLAQTLDRLRSGLDQDAAPD